MFLTLPFLTFFVSDILILNILIVGIVLSDLHRLRNENFSLQTLLICPARTVDISKYQISYLIFRSLCGSPLRPIVPDLSCLQVIERSAIHPHPKSTPQGVRSNYHPLLQTWPRRKHGDFGDRGSASQILASVVCRIDCY